MNLNEAINILVNAIKQKKLLTIRFYSKEDGTILERKCAPLDYGPSRRAKVKNNRFHFWDLDSDQGQHVLSLNLDQIVDITLLNSHFEPRIIVKWDTKKSPWFIPRDWGDVS